LGQKILSDFEKKIIGDLLVWVGHFSRVAVFGAVKKVQNEPPLVVMQAGRG
jgi:hypothetical protein